MAPRNKNNVPTLAPDAPASADYARDRTAFPATCPYSWHDVVSRDFEL